MLTTSRKEGLLKGYASAISLASRAQEAHTHENFFHYAPNLFHHSITLAAMFIMKIVKSTYAEEIDLAQAKKSFSICHALIRQNSLEDNDLRGRTAKIIEQLWNCDDAEKLSAEPSLKIMTRLGGSLLHDTLWAWRERFGGQSSRQPSAPQSPRMQAPSTPWTRKSTSSATVYKGANASLTSADGHGVWSRISQPISSGEQTLQLIPTGDATAIDSQEFLGRVNANEHANSAPSITQPAASAISMTPSGLEPSFDLALMPDDYFDSYWETQLDGLISLDSLP